MKHCILKAMFIVCVLTVISIIPQIADADMAEAGVQFDVKSGKAASAKLMLWDSTETLRPLCTSVLVKIE